ncbi:hypothetical protein AB5J62_17030 [Amycolatopsis sp. cg5]|uniref:hypothetical protein n=1 Tax=Amycolatopsis sp. cg5 TaxID=3238802 RepID=UPI00352370FD
MSAVAKPELVQALFCSPLPVTADLPVDSIRAEIESILQAQESSGCLCDVAQEAGDHPESYLDRIRWCISCVQKAYPQVGAA